MAIKFTDNAARQIVKATQQTLGAPNDQSGSPSHKRSYNDRGFWAKITGNSGSIPYTYTWTEQYDSGSNTLSDKPDGRTDSLGQAVNGWEQSPAGTNSPPIPTGTFVWIILSFDSASPANPVWRFNQLPPAAFPVLVSQTGGSAGSMSGGTTCSFTYTVYAEDGIASIGTGLTPDVPRFSNCEYNTPSYKTPGIAYLDSSGEVHLYSVAQETPKGKVVTNIIGVQVSDPYLQVKTQQQLVLDNADASDWTTVATGTDC